MKKYTDQGAEYTISDEFNSNVKPVFSRKDWAPEYTQEAVEATFRDREAKMRKEKEFFDYLLEKNGGRYVKFSFFDHLSSMFNVEKREQMRKMEEQAQEEARSARKEVAEFDRHNKILRQVNANLAGRPEADEDIDAFVVAQIIKTFG